MGPDVSNLPPIALHPTSPLHSYISEIALGRQHIQARVKKIFKPDLSLPLVMIFDLFNVVSFGKALWLWASAIEK